MRIYPSVPIFGRSLTRDTVFGKTIVAISTSNITADPTYAQKVRVFISPNLCHFANYGG